MEDRTKMGNVEMEVGEVEIRGVEAVGKIEADKVGIDKTEVGNAKIDKTKIDKAAVDKVKMDKARVYTTGRVAAVAAILAATLGLSACSVPASLDVVGRYSISSFNEVLGAIPGQVSADKANVGWSLSAPDGSARFIWSEDYSKSPMHDVMLEFDAQPFLDAGLDPDKLPDNYVYYENGGTGGKTGEMGGKTGETGGVPGEAGEKTGGGMDSETDSETGGGMLGGSGKILMVGTKLGDDQLVYNGAPTSLAAYQQIVSNYRGSLHYHAQLDHFGVGVGDGNVFEWGKDLLVNSTAGTGQDKDIVFVLNPKPLIEAGVVPENVEGWAYDSVEMMEGGLMVKHHKFLKPFDIK